MSVIEIETIEAVSVACICDGDGFCHREWCQPECDALNLEAILMAIDEIIEAVDVETDEAAIVAAFGY